MPPGTFAKLIKVAQHGVESSIVGKESSLLSSAEVLIGQVKTKLPLVNHQLFQSVSFSSVSHLNNTLRHGTTFAVRLDSTNRKKNFSVVGAVSRTFSTPSVSGPGYQICGYHTDRLCAEQTRSLSSGNNMVTIAASGSKVFLSDGLVDNWITKRCYHAVIKNNVSTLCCAKGDDSHKFANMSFNNPDRPNNSCIYGYLVYSTIKSRYNLNFDSWSGWQKFHNFASTSFFAGAASDLLYSLTEDQATGSASLSDEKEALDRSLKLLSGSCYLPHPEKEATGGEDAHFICTEEHAIGVADGVGGWADLGVDAGLYARELMSNSVAAIREEPKGFIDPARVLEKAHSTTKADGSSTACIIALTNEGLHAINLGDSGFVVVREGRAVFQSPVQQHDFNFTYQLERGTNGDLPSSGEVFTVAVAPGDVVVAGTDGLFDNLYNNEITAVVVHALRAGFGPQVTAQKIAALARQRAQDTNRQTPFSTAAQDAGIRYYGGKLDDITVVVSYITSSSNITQRPNWLSKPGG